MRIVSWNCQQALGRKRDALATLAPDVAVLCEAPLSNPLEASLLDGAASWHAAGPYPSKCVAIAGFRGPLTPCRLAADPHRWGVAVTCENGVGVLGVWSVCQPSRRYGDEVLGIVDANSEWIAHGDVVVAGDFNIDAHGVGNGSGGVRLFSDLVARFADLGLISAYHCSSGEPFGEESSMTHFHRRNAARGFHIDYCFIPRAWQGAIREVAVGRPDEWLGLSDHMPILVDIAI